ncbi:dTDP-glucose 4,6-dehydratase [Streptomyces resistomycificus]|uniref:dTDP-glucose 4,6-dehydratase n=2 Tax=Streptomyces resistomycificus TaxID=67356 RepID=A0A0L8L884_9ACTN|nr:dTDP-glucose 4,6-dehydratase [Streptomyces resistomycificus]KUO01895.1 dTDP-glucose 4,6-dehydratase [Streptomyces resistomycificus]
MLLGPSGPPDVAVTVLDNLTHCGGTTNLDDVRGEERFTFVHGDIRDADLVDGLLAEHDQVVHFAAESPAGRPPAGAAACVQTNVLGTQTLLDAALRHRARRFVHISSDEVYGSIRHGSWPETDPLRPNSPRAASKAAADLIALAYHRAHGLDVRVTRCANTYGPHQHPAKVVPLFITRLSEGRPVSLHGDGHHVRDWIHVDDHVRGVELVRALGRPGEVYNIGAGNELSDRELTALLLAACGGDWALVRFVKDRTGHDGRCSVDFTKIRTELGFTPSKGMSPGLAETVDWYRTHRSWWEPLLRRAAQEEGRKRVPL